MSLLSLLCFSGYVFKGKIATRIKSGGKMYNE